MAGEAAETAGVETRCLYSCRLTVVNGFLNPINCPLGRSCRRKDRPTVVTQHSKPTGDVGGMIEPGHRLQSKLGAEKRRSQFGNQLFDGIGLGTKSKTEISIKSRSGPMNRFVTENRIVS